MLDGDRMSDTKEILIDVLRRYDESRDRSTQSEPGASAIGGCRRQAFFRAEGHPEVNYTYKLAAIRGTAFHKHIENAFEWADPTGERFLTELEVPGVPGMGDGHIDFYDRERKTLADWKTTLKKSLRFFPKQQQRWQAQIYGDLLVRAGYQVDWVELVAIPMDGREDEIRVHREPRDPAIAADAYAWLEALNAMRRNGEIPPADLSGKICEEYCPFFGPDSCSGA